jgi:hypothetical protein
VATLIKRKVVEGPVKMNLTFVEVFAAGRHADDLNEHETGSKKEWPGSV